MRLLIVDPIRVERDAVLRLLPAGAHEISVAGDASEALTRLETNEFDIALVEATMIGTTGSELVKRIRATESDTHIYVIVTAARFAAGDVKLAFLAGADDFVRKPVGRDELLARIDAPIRIRRWANKWANGGISSDSSAGAALSDLSAWLNVESTICSEVSDMLGFEFSPIQAEKSIDGAVHVVSVPLTLPSEHAEVCLAVGVDATAAAMLAEAMFGAATIEAAAMKDMMREIANVAAGAFKRSAAAEGRAFFSGLPNEDTAANFRSPAAMSRRQWMGKVEGAPIALHFEIELRIREPKRVRVGALREGMVSAVDVHNRLGALLMPSGTRITESHLSGLARSLGAEMCIDVLDVAA